MTNQEVLEKIGGAVDIGLLRVDFPDIEHVITQLDDGSQEVIFRMQGADPDFYPAGDYAAIDAIGMKDIPNTVKNSITWKRHKKQARRLRKERLLLAIFKRVTSLMLMSGISLRQLHTFIGLQLPVVEGDI